MKKMKNLFIYVFAGLAIMLSSCENYLEVDYYDILSDKLMFESENAFEMSLMGCYDTFYPDRANLPQTSGQQWNFQQITRLAGHPTMDTNALGWDRNYCTQDWTSTSNSEFIIVWSMCYRAIFRTNQFLDALYKVDDSFFADGKKKKDLLEAQVRTIRAMNYFFLYRNFGGVPKYVEGDDYINVPARERSTEKEILDFIIADLEFAHPVLGWTPDQYGSSAEYGRITKGVSLSYLAEAYMWLGALKDAGGNYTSDRSKYYQIAKDLNARVINEGPYKLLPCYSFLFDFGPGWTTEDIWTVVLWNDFGTVMTSGNPQTDHYFAYHFNSASMEYSGWGSLFISWEAYHAFEPGDRRKEASVVGLGETNIWTKQTLGKSASYSKVRHGGEFNPNVSCTKWWRTPANNNVARFPPYAFRYLRLTNVMLNYAECCWALGQYDDPTAWGYINEIRNRAFGNLEVGWDHPAWNHPHADFSGIEACPSPEMTETVDVPDAKTYYTNYKTYFDQLSYTDNPLLVAINLERRKEFLAEFTNLYDFKRTGFLATFLDVEYPYTPNPPVDKNSEAYLDVKQSWRHFQNSPTRLAYYPIPNEEFITNKALTLGLVDPIRGQNPGY